MQLPGSDLRLSVKANQLEYICHAGVHTYILCSLEVEAMLRRRHTEKIKKRSPQLLLISHDFAAMHESLAVKGTADIDRRAHQY
jgi:hypothetical protein